MLYRALDFAALLRLRRQTRATRSAAVRAARLCDRFPAPSPAPASDGLFRTCQPVCC